MMHDHGKSDGPISVPEKPANNARQPAAEQVEGRGPVKGNLFEQTRPRTQRRSVNGHGEPYAGTKPETADTDKGKPTATCGLSRALERIRKVAECDKEARFTALYHHICRLDCLEEAYRGLNRHASPGIDGETWEQYGQNLESNLRDLADRLRRGAYRAKPVRRVFIPKPDGRERPLGVTALEDKIVQTATVRVLNAVYEADFKRFSFGFRPGRGPHDALDWLYAAVVTRKVNWILDCDIRAYFDSISQAWLVRFIEHRIADQRVIRLILKWLKAGVLEDGETHRSEEGTPQGGCISPLLANIYLHYVFDLWVGHWTGKHARGETIPVRYADDTVVCFQHRSDAEQFLKDLRERFAQFSLELHPEKSRLLEFGRYAAERRKRRGLGKPETFNFLGFTHICGRSRKGDFILLRRTMRQRLTDKLKEVRAILMRRRHAPVPEQGQWLARVIAGHYRYYGVPTNSRRLVAFLRRCGQLWHRALCRRSQKGYVHWDRMTTLIQKWLPPPRVCHPNPLRRLAV